MTRQTLDQLRAQHAWKTIEESQRKLAPKDWDSFKGEAKKLPVRIGMAGLGHAVAFLEAKGKVGFLTDALGDWVLSRAAPDVTVQQRRQRQALTQAIKDRDSTFLRRATDEALAYLQWLNRFAEAADRHGQGGHG